MSMDDKRIGGTVDDDSYNPYLRKLLTKAKTNTNFNPELLRVSADDFKKLPYEKKVHWITAHFILTNHASLFEDEYEYENEYEFEYEYEYEIEDEVKGKVEDEHEHEHEQ